MALLLHSSPSSLITTNKTHFHLHNSTPKSKHLSIKSQDPSSSSEDTTTTTTTTSSSPSIVNPPSTKPNSTGLGFGSSNDANPVTTTTTKKKQKGKGEKGSVIRRAPVQKPKFGSEIEEVKAQEQGQSESAFLLTWTGLGALILVEGLILAASGFLPEEWDKFFVKYLYPSFTPTVFLFVAGSVAYGVFKYLQNEKFNREN